MVDDWKPQKADKCNLAKAMKLERDPNNDAKHTMHLAIQQKVWLDMHAFIGQDHMTSDWAEIDLDLRAKVTNSVRDQHPYLHWFKNNWATYEIMKHTLAHRCNHAHRERVSKKPTQIDADEDEGQEGDEGDDKGGWVQSKEDGESSGSERVEGDEGEDEQAHDQDEPMHNDKPAHEEEEPAHDYDEPMCDDNANLDDNAASGATDNPGAGDWNWTGEVDEEEEEEEVITVKKSKKRKRTVVPESDTETEIIALQGSLTLKDTSPPGSPPPITSGSCKTAASKPKEPTGLEESDGEPAPPTKKPCNVHAGTSGATATKSTLAKPTAAKSVPTKLTKAAASASARSTQSSKPKSAAVNCRTATVPGMATVLTEAAASKKTTTKQVAPAEKPAALTVAPAARSATPTTKTAVPAAASTIPKTAAKPVASTKKNKTGVISQTPVVPSVNGAQDGHGTPGASAMAANPAKVTPTCKKLAMRPQCLVTPEPLPEVETTRTAKEELISEVEQPKQRRANPPQKQARKSS
ncbi:hypothetical protein FRC06_002758 [Ceratobasidium sp. 370]|nr:hypothetical protein FRC06_002758 [Ceratobasidium sp. 370]